MMALINQFGVPRPPRAALLLTALAVSIVAHVPSVLSSPSDVASFAASDVEYAVGIKNKVNLESPSQSPSPSSSQSQFTCPATPKDVKDGGFYLKDHGKTLVDWFESTDGSFFHPHLEVKKLQHLNQNRNIAPNTDDASCNAGIASSSYGLFASKKIQAHELLLEIPPSLILAPGPPQVGDRIFGLFIREDEDDSKDEDDDDDEEDEYDRLPGVVTAVQHSAKDGTLIYSVWCDVDQEPETDIPETAVEHDQDPINCATVRLVAKELQKHKNNSNNNDKKSSTDSNSYAPYLNYLLATSVTSTSTHPVIRQVLPTRYWSKAGQSLLKQVLGRDRTDGTNVLPPYQAFSSGLVKPLSSSPLDYYYLDEDWKRRCNMEQIQELDGSSSSKDNHEHDSLAINEQDAYRLVMQNERKIWDRLKDNNQSMLVPFLDMLSHRHGRWANTYTDLVYNSTTTSGPGISNSATIKVYASRDIEAGEKLFTSYYNNYNKTYSKLACRSRKEQNCPIDNDDEDDESYGTPEILRDYGFVEDYPRRFSFEEQEIAFDIDYVYNRKGENKRNKKSNLNQEGSLNSSFPLVVNWIGPVPKEKGQIEYLEEQLERLIKVNQTTMSKFRSTVPQHEYNVISQYLEALITAMTKAIANIPNSGASQDTCSIFSSSPCYPTLQTETESWSETRPITCDYNTEFNYKKWKTVSEIKSPYHEMAFDINPTMKNDMCFDLDTVVQMCASYRPHYHEMFVHYSARFIEQIKRVLFVGGGDSMLLHEALKYPSLELVVGLELDQAVARNSYKHFGTQPHWDNEKVEWWFGDATKSLLVLPKEYFGSFDLVLVDLSETAMALTVTDELDVMQALSLLVKPNSGIFVQNEYDHFMGLAEHFRNTVSIHYYSVPVVCSQSLVLSSNGVDFLRGPYKNHEVQTLLDLLDQPNVRYEVIRDFQKNTTNPHHCNNFYYKGGASPSKDQVQSPGVLMIVEAEDVTVNLHSTKTVQDLVTKTLTKAGSTVVSSSATATKTSRTKTSQDNDAHGYTLAFLLREGYVVARVFPDRHYVAYDLHFWSHFEKQDAARKALIQAVGSSVSGKSSSAFRIVAGGIFGLDNWVEETKKLGPHLEELCSDAGDSSSASPLKPKAPMTTAATAGAGNNASSSIRTKNEITTNFSELLLQETMMAVYSAHEYPVVAVLCGLQGQECTSAKVLENIPNVEVIPIWNCPSTATDGGKDKQRIKFVEDDDKSLVRMVACEKQILQTLLHRTSSSNKKINAVVLDPTATYHLARIVARIFRTSKQQLLVNHENNNRLLIHATILEGNDTANAAPPSSIWSQAFVDYFRQQILKSNNDDDPPAVYRAEISFRGPAAGNQSNFKVAMAVSGDKLFPQSLSHLVDRIEKEHLCRNQSAAVSNCFDYEVEIQNLRAGEFAFEDDLTSHATIFTHKDYDQSDSLKQWEEQMVLGTQTVFQMEVLKNGRTSALLSCEQLQEVLHRTVSRVVGVRQVVAPTQGKAKTPTEEDLTSKVGEGCIVASLWSRGNAILLWDGRNHIDINLFSDEVVVDGRNDAELKQQQFSNRFEKTFLNRMKLGAGTVVKTNLRDEFPRGTGRVITFPSSNKASYDEEPYWK